MSHASASKVEFSNKYRVRPPYNLIFRIQNNHEFEVVYSASFRGAYYSVFFQLSNKKVIMQHFLHYIKTCK